MSSNHSKRNINNYNYLYTSIPRRAFEPTAPAFATSYGCHHNYIVLTDYSLVFNTELVRATSGATSSKSQAQETNFGHQRPRHLLQLLVWTDNVEKLSQLGCDLYIWTDHPGTQDALHYLHEISVGVSQSEAYLLGGDLRSTRRVCMCFFFLRIRK